MKKVPYAGKEPAWSRKPKLVIIAGKLQFIDGMLASSNLATSEYVKMARMEIQRLLETLKETSNDPL